MSINFILATLQNGGLGKDNTLPWHIPEDLKFFKEMTKGKTVIMGYRTYLSIGNKPLPSRNNYILSMDKNKYTYDINSETGYIFSVGSREDILELIKEDEEVFVIGGEQAFILFEKYVDKVYHTVITDEKYNTINCDTFYDPRKRLPISYSNKIMANDKFTIYEHVILK